MNTKMDVLWKFVVYNVTAAVDDDEGGGEDGEENEVSISFKLPFFRQGNNLHNWNTQRDNSFKKHLLF